ncbi:hypothetical protein J2N86_15515 (plasmid) [Legionella lytica]|uniref:Integrase catalytic domain-containing protein n=1 Tax=Legionella lytica TaxID=96232 RepID=A0ABY4YDI4_9GAMM|nr:hypothetical protein [Legionella lytica]USQ15556.1 hypothetical protein J2N86_15515 [Legionella lytica]
MDLVLQRETAAFARKLGFDVRATPAYSPERNGMAEAFVKRLREIMSHLAIH